MFYRHPDLPGYLAYRHNGAVLFFDRYETTHAMPHGWPAYVSFMFCMLDMPRCTGAENIRFLRELGWQIV